MKRFLICCGAVLTALALSTTVTLAKTGWSDNFSKAVAQGKAEKKLVLLDFTGSDWCVWCMKLDKEVFSTPEFKSYAKDHLVLMEVDFPQQKPQSNKIKEQNDKLQAKYKIEGYPTVVVLDSTGNQIGQLPYAEGGPKAFIAALEKLKK